MKMEDLTQNVTAKVILMILNAYIDAAKTPDAHSSFFASSGH
jgi:hypothetical protein